MNHPDSYLSWPDDSVFPALKSPFFEEHLARYRFALDYIKGNNVLEVACGKGYGSKIMSEYAKNILAIDLNKESLDFAKKNYQADNIKFVEWDGTRLGSLQGYFDVITAFEILEHIPPIKTDALLKGIVSKLAPHGHCIISTPNHEVVIKSGSPVPEFHINNFKAKEFKNLLSRYFSKVVMFGQVKSQGKFRDFLHWIDFFQLRHLKISKLLRTRIAPVDQAASFYGGVLPDSPRLWTPDQGWGESSRYFFSRMFWRQAGMALAICKK